MNTIKHKHILIFIIIFVFIAGAFSIVKVRAMNNQNSAVVVANVDIITLGHIPNTVNLQISTISTHSDTDGTLTIDVPFVESSREMNRNIRTALENYISGVNPIVGKNDKLILLGAAENL